MNSGIRVSIPNSVRKTVQNIKEITGNHSEDEIYAMLRECSMDPNETTQKLLLQDPFHEVKRKRDRKKEDHIKESTEPRWKPGMQGRGNRGGRGNYSSRHISHGSSKNAHSAKENEINKTADVVKSLPNVATDKNPVDQVKETPAEIKTASGEIGSLLLQGKMFQAEENNNRPQQAIGPQKVGSVKEWKPKPTNPISAQELVTEMPAVPIEDHFSLKSTSNILESKEREEPQISNGQHVIIPNHLHVPEIEKLGFHFGSFDSTFGINPTSKSPSVSEEIIENDGVDLDRPSSSSNLSPEGATSSSSNVGPKQETSPPNTNPVVHPSSNINFGFNPPFIGIQIAPSEIESQASRVPNFVVQQPFDPAGGYYPQFYRSGADNDGRISPFHPPGKYNGNIPVLSQQSSQEVGNSLLSGAGAGGPMQSSIAVSQQPLPVFRQPTGLHYPPNYIPYGPPYFSPFFIPPPAIHQFLSNGGFPQNGGMYPVANPKYPVPQYKPISNTGHSGSNPGVTAANLTSNEDVTGQQSEGSGVWIAGRDISGSFYNVPRVPFASIYHHPAQPVTTHPLVQQAQTMGGPVDMVGPTSSPYQQQPTQMNWPNNY